MKTSTIITMAFAMIASCSSAMPSPLWSDFNSTHSDRKGGFTLQAREDEVPRCSVPCIQNAIAKVTDCHFTDYACACKYHGKVTSAATSCVVGACGLQRAMKVVVPAVRKLCQKEAEKEKEGKEEEEKKKVKRDLEDEYDDEVDLYDEQFDEYEDEEESEEQAKRQLIVPDKDDLGFDIDPLDVDDFDEEE